MFLRCQDFLLGLLRGEGAMVQRVSTVAFEGIEARAVDVQVQVAPGLPAFTIVGLPDKAVSEARERVRSALIASGLALPARRITVNLAPADVPKEGSHYDLPIALGLMAAIGAIPPDALTGFTVWANWVSMARSRRSPVCFPRR
jgi:magnesium chelatase family protein